jgi:hypothetical protein
VGCRLRRSAACRPGAWACRARGPSWSTLRPRRGQPPA